MKLALEDVALAVMGHLGFIAEARARRSARERHGNDLFGAFGKDFVDRRRRARDGRRPDPEAVARALRGDRDRGRDRSARDDLGLDLDAEGDRFRARESIADRVGAWIGAQPFDTVKRTFDAHGVCWSRYQTVEQLVREDPACSAANPLFRRIDQPGVGRVLAPGIPLRFSAFPQRAPRPAPRLGEHTEEVLLDVLRLDHAGYGRLVDRGIAGG